MPIYIYKAKNDKKGCSYCRGKFELLQKVNARPLKKCPKCGAAIKRIFSSFSLGASKTDLDTRAKAQGFHKLKRVDKGKFEKLY